MVTLIELHPFGAFEVLFATEDSKEGMQAFIEKRKPSYRGR